MSMTIYPSEIQGKLQVPASKSYMQRALVAGLLSSGKTEITNPGTSDDDLHMLNSIERLGARVSRDDEILHIQGGLSRNNKVINVGESGLAIRLLAPVTSLFNEEMILEGKGSLINRPMKEMENTLTALGVSCDTTMGYPPVRIKGPIKGGTATLDGSYGSQFLSGLLFTLPLAPNNSTLYVKNLQSKPYIDLTMQVLQKHGIKIANQSYEVFEIKGNQSYHGAHHFTEGDWSNAAFLLVAGAINGNIELAGLHEESAQGDRIITKVLEKCGALINQKAELWHAKATPSLKAFEWDATDTPDLFPPLACLAAYCEGTSRIKGVNRLIHKESNRAEALITEFGKQGIDISQEEDYLVIKGGIPQGGPFHSHNDHRIAMAGAILALKSKAPVQMTGHEAVHKSYPGFFEDLRKLQVKTEENE